MNNDWTIAPLIAVDVSDVTAWIRAIPFSNWPQQSKVDEQLRPAMVNDIAWQGFGKVTDGLVADLLAHINVWLAASAAPTRMARDYNRMLSVVMPGHSIPPHRDAQDIQGGWLYRVHVPLRTNPMAVTRTGRVDHHLEVGMSYALDTRAEHAIRNDGDTPRIHFMFDVRAAR